MLNVMKPEIKPPFEDGITRSQNGGETRQIKTMRINLGRFARRGSYRNLQTMKGSLRLHYVHSNPLQLSQTS